MSGILTNQSGTREEISFGYFHHGTVSAKYCLKLR